MQPDRAGTGRESAAEGAAREPTALGPYLLLAEIARGELSHVYLAKKESALGFQRLYALKRLRPGLAGSLEHVELLLDEARVMSGIHHPNLAGVLDVGTDGGSYVVMEYVEGENLENLLARAGAARRPRYVVPALVDALHGLHALHTAIADAGEPSGIVHQAPRARHVLVGVDGSARLIDFSQVRAPGVRSSRCRSDRLKVACMAPEMALHPDGVDLRADVFVAGVALWEALTGERLFAGDNDVQTFQNMLHRRVPLPSEVGLKAPRCFDAICMRALERDRAKRYESALELARDLCDAARSEGLYASSEEIGEWVRELAGPELRERRRRAGIETQDAAGISPQTPTLGFERGAPAQVVLERAAGARAADVAEGAAPGADAAGSPALGGDAQRESDEAAVTPPVGMRRAALPRAEAADDEPTGRRSSLPEPSRSSLGSRSSPRRHDEDLARAVTLPVLAHATASGVPGVSEPAAIEAPPASAADLHAGDEREQTQPNRFVPARPGARRDAFTASPGAYSQVESRRGRSSVAPEPERVGVSFDDVATTTHPGLAARAERAIEHAPAARERSSVPPASQRSRVAPVPTRRPITEMPPTYVQRRDSNPTRMQIPDGPVGAPHRSFPQEDASSDVHRVQAQGVARVQTQGVGAAPVPSVAQAPVPSVAQAQDALALRAAASEPSPPDEERDQSQPRVRRSEFALLQLGMIDSLSPPIAASLTTPPKPRDAAGRSWPLWLASGVLTAIILLALGVGIRQWIAGPTHALPSTRQAAHGEPAFAAPARAAPVREPPAERPGAAASTDVANANPPPAAVSAPAAAPVSAPAASPARTPRAIEKRAPRVEAKRGPVARRAARSEPAEAPVKRQPQPAKPAASVPAQVLPDNPY